MRPFGRKHERKERGAEKERRIERHRRRRKGMRRTQGRDGEEMDIKEREGETYRKT